MFVKVFIVACFVSASVIATPVLKKVDQTSSKPPSVKNICGGIDVIELDSDTAHGFISSPGYPGTYPASIIDPEDCGSQVTVANNTIDSVLLGFLQLRLRPGDYLSIKQTFYNPPSERTEQLTGSYDVFLPDLLVANETVVYLQSDATETKTGYLAAYAGKLLPPPPTAQEQPAKEKPVYDETNDVTRQTIRINVESGEVWTDSDDHDLVRQMVQHVPGKQFGVLMSPNHPQNYPTGVDFDYDIVAPEGSKVALRLLRLELESCCDYINISNGDGTTSFISSMDPSIIYATGNEVTLSFRSDSSVSRRGFMLAYSSISP